MVIPVDPENQDEPGSSESVPSSTETMEPTSEQGDEEVVHFSQSTPSDEQYIAPVHEPVQHDEEALSDKQSANVDQEVTFPLAELEKLDEMINKPRWVVPVLPDGELKILLVASIDLCKKGLDIQSTACQTFFREGLTISFTKILTDDAVNGWKHEIQKCIMSSCRLLIDLCTLKLSDDWIVLLDLLAMALNPNSKFHLYNGNKPSELSVDLDEQDICARSHDSRPAKGWLVDLVNQFGKNGGFKKLRDRFLVASENGQPLSFTIISALIKPFGLCHEVLTTRTVEEYFLPIVDKIKDFLDQLSDEELKKESKNETKNDALSGLVKGLKWLISRVPGEEKRIRDLEIFRLKMILRLLKISSFNGKMNALNEVNKVISNVTGYYQRHGQVSSEEEEWLTADKMANWIQENEVLDIVLRDSLHQPQYVEKLEKILRFMIKEKALGTKDLDRIWGAQHGKHDAIIKNIHELLAKLAWDFSPEQLDHLFKCFQDSWHHANKKQREKLLELIRRLAEDDKEGVMAQKVLGLLWNLAHSDDCPTDIMDQALAALIKILDYSCSQDRDQQKIKWIYQFVDELKNNAKWVLPALKQISEICKLFTEAPATYGIQPSGSRTPHILYRNQVISDLQSNYSIVMTVAQNLVQYIEQARAFAKDNSSVQPEDYLPDDRFDHNQQVNDRLKFLRFLLKDGQLWLCAPQAKQIWKCLAINAAYPSDREACFKWFTKLMGEDPDLDPEITKNFFVEQILRLDPALLTESGIGCFDRFFRNVNIKDNRLMERRKGLMMDDLELIGMDYLWRVILHGSDLVAEKAISLMKELHANLGPRLHAQLVDIHSEFISDCFERLRASFDTLSCLTKDSADDRLVEAKRMVRVITVLTEYISECDHAYGEERALLPLSRACRGRPLSLIVRFPNQNRHEDIEVFSHTNDTLGCVRRQVLQKSKMFNSNCKVELYMNGELLETHGDKGVISQIPIRDKSLLTAKLLHANSNMTSASDSSSESSQGASPGTGNHDGPNLEAESCLPGVILANDDAYIPFLLRLCDYAMSSTTPLTNLQQSIKDLLHLTPPHKRTMQDVRDMCVARAQHSGTSYTGPRLESIMFSSASEGPISPSKAVYTLEVIYTLLMPSQDIMSENTLYFQRTFIESGGVSLSLKALSQNDFMFSAIQESRRDATLLVLKMSKLTLLSAAHAVVHCVADRLRKNEQVNNDEHRAAVQLQDDLQQIQLAGTDPILKHVAGHIAKQLMAKACAVLPTESAIRAVLKIAWCSACGSLDCSDSSPEEMQREVEQMREIVDEDAISVQVTCAALEVLTLCLTLHPSTIDSLQREKSWQHFIIDMILIVKSRPVRLVAQEQFLLIARQCRSTTLHFFITLLFTIEMVKVPQYSSQSSEYFGLLCLLLNGQQMETQVPQNESKLQNEIAWLMEVRRKLLETGTVQVEDALLEGHLGLARELILPLGPNKKVHYGNSPDGPQLVKHLMEDFIFPASRVLMDSSRGKLTDFPQGYSTAVCQNPGSINAAYDLLVALCTGCVQNITLVTKMLTGMFYEGEDTTLVEWEFLPPVGSRPQHGFVGLKNGGATCYMNSVLQQLFMIPEIQEGILTIDDTSNELDESDTQMDLKSSGNLPSYSQITQEKSELIEKQPVESTDPSAEEPNEKAYNMGVVKQVQIIFAHLAYSKLQFFIPKGFWKQFRIQGEQVNLREQHDALEFMERLVDSCDEALKQLNKPPVCSRVLGGSYADQKICKDCPHRYSNEQSFTALNVEIRNHHNLKESLEQYVKGDLLEGANAYFCEKCGKKVDTVKRMCVKKLPHTLAIQLKRFEYDWERDCSIKFNDYFEFPRELDMEPYTVYGLAKIEGERVLDEDGEKSFADQSTKYRLSGIVVHSGQASGGHYYSYIQHRAPSYSEPKWYKYDDGDVSECRMDDDEELKKECFGGEYTGEVFDHMLKRMSFRRQKRWWNAYILMYERIPSEELNTDEKNKEVSLAKDISSLSISDHKIKIPPAIERIVWKQNLQFMHNRNQFCPEYFHFMKKLLNCNSAYLIQHQQLHPGQALPPELEQLSKISAQLASQFLFSVGFHTKKTLRGPAGDWYEALSCHFRGSQRIRYWFAQTVLFAHPQRFSEYLLECPSTEVRNTFAKIIAFLAHCSRQDGPSPPPKKIYGDQVPDENSTLSDHLLVAVLSLLRKEVSEHGRHITQYFHLFVMYANLGPEERKQLLNLNVAATFIQVALDEGPGPTIKYQYAELTKLYSVVSLLLRDCDMSSECQTEDKRLLGANPYSLPGGSLFPLQPSVSKLLFKSKAFIKKIIEDNINSEDTRQLMLYLCWENPVFSADVLSELLWQIAYCYTYEMRPYLDMLQCLLQMDDSWQSNRLLKSLVGSQEEKDGLFDVIHRSKNHYQKRAYQCIKMLVALFSKCETANKILYSDASVMEKWTTSVDWLNEEMERRAYGGGNNQYSYNNWSPPTQSNETSNGYFLERSQSAKITLANALELCPEEESADADMSVDNVEDVPEENTADTNLPPSPSKTTEPGPSTNS